MLLLSGKGAPKLKERRLRSMTTAKILDFLEGYGPSSTRFMSDFYGVNPQSMSAVCQRLRRDGILVGWAFDGHLLYGLPEQAPTDPVVLAAPFPVGRPMDPPSPGKRERPSTRPKNPIARYPQQTLLRSL